MKKMDTLATILGILVLIFSFVLGFVVDSNYWYVSATEQNFHDMENIAYSIMSESTEAPSGYSILNEGNKTLIKRENTAGYVEASWENGKIVVERINRGWEKWVRHILIGIGFVFVAFFGMLIINVIIIGPLFDMLQRPKYEYS
ncbi:MAG: hypothetical protein IJH76_00435 [Clostridia bacterium]|nr:hypothetical protein [Clostridia bacterium]